MKIKSVIDYVDEIKPNAFSNEVKTMWLNECEGMIQTEIFLFAPLQILIYDYEKDKEKHMLVEPPHDKLYAAYLAAKIDYANGEYSKYENSRTMFQAHYNEFVRWYATHYRPADIFYRKDYV